MAPKYQRIVDALLSEMDSMHAGDKIETEIELAARFDVSRMTIRQALQVLTAMGRVVGIRGRGTFIADARIHKSGARGGSFTQLLTSQNLTPSTRLLHSKELRAPAIVAVELDLEEDARVFEVRRLRLGDGAPLCIETSYLSRASYPDMNSLNLELSLYELLSKRYNVRFTDAEVRFSAQLATREQATLLDIRPGSAVMRAISITHDDRGQKIERTESIYRGDRYEFQLSGPVEVP